MNQAIQDSKLVRVAGSPPANDAKVSLGAESVNRGKNLQTHSPDASRDGAANRDSEPVRIWGIPLAPFTLEGTLNEISRRIRDRVPCYFITANVNYAMLTESNPELRKVNEEAAFILADGMPLVWASRWRKTRLPERVPGSDLVPALCKQAAQQGHRVFLLGGAPGVGEAAATKLTADYPGLQIVGIEAPTLKNLSQSEHRELIERIRMARPDLLFVALGQPLGEFWVHRHYQDLRVPVCVQVGATIDFMAGRVPRAPLWMQSTGMEWMYRLYREPRRLAHRYFSNSLFLVRAFFRDLFKRTSP